MVEIGCGIDIATFVQLVWQVLRKDSAQLSQRERRVRHPGLQGAVEVDVQQDTPEIEQQGLWWAVGHGGLSRRQKQKARQSRAFCLNRLGWLMGLEPTTTGITILDSTN
jgi:hypothetical protein